MKVKCEYCESYVEADENMKCPLCNAPLSGSVEAVQKREEEAEQAAYERAAEVQEQEAKNEHISEIIQGVTNVASAVVAGVTATNIANTTGTTQDGHRPPMPPDGRPGSEDAFGRERPHRHENPHSRDEDNSRNAQRHPRTGGHPDGMRGHPGRRR